MKQALEMALEALQVATTPLAKDRQEVLRAITAIKEALAQPEQEPLCTAAMFDDAFLIKSGLSPHTKLYTTPPQPEQETVAHTLNCVCGAVWDIKNDGSEEMVHAPDTTPPQRKPLTDEQILHFVDIHVGAPSMAYPLDNSDWITFARAIEAAHGIKE